MKKLRLVLVDTFCLIILLQDLVIADELNLASIPSLSGGELAASESRQSFRKRHSLTPIIEDISDDSYKSKEKIQTVPSLDDTEPRFLGSWFGGVGTDKEEIKEKINPNHIVIENHHTVAKPHRQFDYHHSPHYHDHHPHHHDYLRPPIIQPIIVEPIHDDHHHQYHHPEIVTVTQTANHLTIRTVTVTHQLRSHNSQVHDHHHQSVVYAHQHPKPIIHHHSHVYDNHQSVAHGHQHQAGFTHQVSQVHHHQPTTVYGNQHVHVVGHQHTNAHDYHQPTKVFHNVQPVSTHLVYDSQPSFHQGGHPHIYGPDTHSHEEVYIHPPISPAIQNNAILYDLNKELGNLQNFGWEIGEQYNHAHTPHYVPQPTPIITQIVSVPKNKNKYYHSNYGSGDDSLKIIKDTFRAVQKGFSELGHKVQGELNRGIDQVKSQFISDDYDYDYNYEDVILHPNHVGKSPLVTTSVEYTVITHSPHPAGKDNGYVNKYKLNKHREYNNRLHHEIQYPNQRYISSHHGGSNGLYMLGADGSSHDVRYPPLGQVGCTGRWCL